VPTRYHLRTLETPANIRLISLNRNTSTAPPLSR